MKKTLVTLLIILLTSCSSKDNNLIVVLKDRGDIKEGNSIFLNNIKVGEVEKVDLNSAFDVCVTIFLYERLKLSVDSKFKVTQKDLIETIIEIDPGISKSLLSPNDSVRGTHKGNNSLDFIIETITDAVDHSKPVRNQDSIIKELQNLNEEVKKLNKDINSSLNQ
jgi:ABC-type transporter Mla subunit MlaD